MTKYIIFSVVILLIVIALILALCLMDRKKKKTLVKNETKLREEGKVTSNTLTVKPKKTVKVKEQARPHKSKKFGKLKVNEEALDKILSSYKNSETEVEIEQQEEQTSFGNDKNAELEDFTLQEQEEEKKEQAESTSENFSYKIQNPFNMSRTPTHPVKLDDDKNDEDDEDDDFADIEKAYQEFLERKKQEALGGMNNYNIEDFKRDYFERNIDIDEILEKLTPELKNEILKFLLNKSNLTEEDF